MTICHFWAWYRDDFTVLHVQIKVREKNRYLFSLYLSLMKIILKKQICVHTGSDEYWKTLLRDWNLAAWPNIKACAHYLKFFSSLPGRFCASEIRFWCKISLFTDVTPSFQPSKSDLSHVSMHKYYASA